MASQHPLRADPRNASGWYAALPEPAPANRLTGDQSADWVVVGAGVTGLAAARRLGELAPDARVLLLDEHGVGYGASGRNSGFIIDTPHLSERLSAKDNRRVSRLVVAGLADLESHVREHDIDCEWSARGHLTAVVDPRREKKLHATARMLDATDEDYEWYDRNTIARVTGTGHYHAAVLTPRTVLVNPAALCRGLGETLPGNVELYEQTPVHRVEPGSPVRIECAEASISAGNVLLTTNAFVARLGFLRRDVFPDDRLRKPLAADDRRRTGRDGRRVRLGHHRDHDDAAYPLESNPGSQRTRLHMGFPSERTPAQTARGIARGDIEEAISHACQPGLRAHLGRRVLHDPELGVALRPCRTRRVRLTGLLWRRRAPRHDLRKAARRICHGFGVGPDRRRAGAVPTQTAAAPAVSRNRDSSKSGMVQMEFSGRGVTLPRRSVPRQGSDRQMAQQG